MPAWAAPPRGPHPHFGPPPPGYRPTRSSNAGLIATLSVAGVVVLLVGVVGLVAVTTSGDRSTDVAYEPGPTTTSSPYPTGTTTSYPTTTEPTTTTETYEPTETTDDYTDTQEPTTTEEAPEPEGPKPVYALADNPLFAKARYGLKNYPCTLARWHDDRSAATDFFASAITCMDKEWQTLLDSLGLPFRSPSLQVPATRNAASGPCGSSGESFAAFYCPTNETIYLPWDSIQVDKYGAHPGVYLALLAHEYGHHVQQLSGIQKAVEDKQYDAGGYESDAGLTLQRRMELQAQCFSGMFVTAAGGDVDDTIAGEAVNSQNDRGDDNGEASMRSHGTSAHYDAWWQQGFDSNRTAQCNTWESPASDVA